METTDEIKELISKEMATFDEVKRRQLFQIVKALDLLHNSHNVLI